MHMTHARKPSDRDGFKITTQQFAPNLFSIQTQIAHKAIAQHDRRLKMKSARKARKWKED